MASFVFWALVLITSNCVYIFSWLLFFLLPGTSSSSPVPSLFSCLSRLMSGHGDLHLAMPDQLWGAPYSGLRGEKASVRFGKPQYSALWLDSSLNSVIYSDACRLLVSGSGCSRSAYSNSALWTYWFKNNNKKPCRSAVLYNLLFLCLSSSILCHCEWKKKLGKECCLSQA